MPFALDVFARSRPFLYHLTASRNLERIRRTRSLEPASVLMYLAGNPTATSRRRRDHIQLDVAGEIVHIRDQAPLHAGNVRLEGGWSFDDLVRALNERVFFWPGTERGPISYGVRHFKRYEAEQPLILRVQTEELLAENPDVAPLFCKYNSGSPRCSRGIGSPRGPRTFIAADVAPFHPAACVEVTFAGRVALPQQTFASSAPTGPWRMLANTTAA